MATKIGKTVRDTGPFCGEFTGDRWIPLTKASVADLWCLLWSAPEQKVEQTIETPVIWDAIVQIMTSLYCCLEFAPTVTASWSTGTELYHRPERFSHRTGHRIWTDILWAG